MTSIQIRRHELRFLPDCSRVLIRPFIPADRSRLTQIIGRALALSEEETGRELEKVRREFSARHHDLDSLLLGIYRRVEVHVFTDRSLSTARRLLIGALFSGEYALESAALFNPSIVPHPDQSGLEPGALRFIMSLRAIGVTVFYHVQAGVIESQEFLTSPIPHWLFCFSDTLQGSMQRMLFVVLLPNGMVVQPKIAERL
jgi:hypothetical protein